MEALLGQIIDIMRAVGPGVVFVVTLVETAFFIGLLVPAEATILVAAFLAAEQVFELEHVLAATILGGLAGDQIGYSLGRLGGRRAAAKQGWLGRLWSRHEARATVLFRSHAIVAVSLARFVSFVRTLMPWFAGMTRMPWPRFFFYDVLGVVAWGTASVFAGFLARESWHVVARAIGSASALLIGVVLLSAAIVVWRRRAHAGVPHDAGERTDGARTGGNHVYRVALTGNIASGKSSVADVWQRLGATLIDADVLARRAVEPGTPGAAAVAAAFDADVVQPDGAIDRAALRQRVFADAAARQRLEAILHPEIERLRQAAERSATEAGKNIVAHIIPLLFEVGMERAFDTVVLVDAPEAVRLERLVSRRGLAPEEAQRMIAAQWAAARKRNPDVIVIENAGTPEQLEARAAAVWRDIERRAAQ